MKTPAAGLPGWWLRYGGALLVAAAVLSWLLPLPSWVQFLWNLLVVAGCFHLMASHRAHRSRDGDGGRDEA